MLQIPARFDALFALALHVHGSPAGMALPWEEVAARIHELARSEQGVPAGECTPEDLTDARFAAYAFVDEVLFRSPRPGEVSGLGWSVHALQNRYFGTNDGGELFFIRLENVLNRLEQMQQEREVLPQTGKTDMQLFASRSTDLAARFSSALGQAAAPVSGHNALAVFAQCLAWGFRGKLYTSEDTLRELRSAACSMLCAASAPLPPVELPPAMRKVRVPFLNDCEPLLHVLVPLTISVAWYFLCADIITRAIRF